MKKLLLLILLSVGMTLSSMATAPVAQTDSSSTATASKSTSRFHTELSLASRNVARGVSFGSSPSIQMLASYNVCPYLELGTYGFATLNGNREGYGNQVNVYGKVKLNKEISVTVDDYFFLASNDNFNEWSTFSKDKTSHFIEARAKYDSRFDFTAAYTFFQNSAYGNNKAIYMEVGYDVTKDFNFFAGYITDESPNNFYTDGGVTSVGGTVSTSLNKLHEGSVLKTSLIFAPNHNNVVEAPGVGHAGIYLVATLNF